MNNLKKYIGIAFAAVAACSGFTACQDDVDAPGMKVPVATLQANKTIAEVKQQYWNNADNYIDTIKLKDNNDEHVVVSGRVISSDASGNIYKSLVIQDATGALAMSINANSLYNDYRVGQEIVVDLTDMYIGKYSTLQQLGFPDYSAAYGWQATFMPLEFFKEHVQLNGLPEPAAIDTLTISLGDLGNGNETQMKYQSQLVRLNNVYFEDGGEKSFCDGHKINTNRTLKDDNGNKITVRTSGYANYWSVMLPAEHGDVVGILSTYKSNGNLEWQLLMRSTSDLLNFGDPTLPKGTETNPYDVLEAIDMVAAGNAVSAWYTGYIVGSLKAGVTEVASDEDILWGAEAEVNNTLVIGQTAESNTLADCMLITLPQGSALREYGNLRDVPENYKKQIWVLATPGTVMDMNAFTGNTGAANEFRIEGVKVPGGEDTDPIAEGDGTEAKPYNPTQVLAKGDAVNETGKWVSGYIVGYIPDKKLEEAVFTVPATSNANILIATTPDEKDYKKCVPVQLPSAQSALRAALNLQSNPGNLGKVCSVYGNLIKYFLVAGVKETSNYKLDGQGGDTTQPANHLNEEPFNTSQADFTIHNVSLSPSLTYVWTHDSSYGYMKASAFSGQSYASDSWLMSPVLDLSAAQNPVLKFDHVTNKFPSLDVAKQQVSLAVSVDGGDWQTVAIPNWSTNSDWTFVNSGDISLAAYAGKKIKLGFHYTSTDGASGSWEIKNLSITGSGSITATPDTSFPGGGSGSGTETPNPPVTGGNTADLNTLTVSSSYKTFTTTNGWVAANCAVQSGGDKDANPVFQFIGTSDDIAVCLNGKSSAPGSLTSPTLTGGIKTLTFKYGFAFSDKQCDFTINIKQNGSVVKTKTVNVATVTKLTAIDFSWSDINVTGDFVIEIVNDCKTGTDKNVDRVSIWNISWTN